MQCCFARQRERAARLGIGNHYHQRSRLVDTRTPVHPSQAARARTLMRRAWLERTWISSVLSRRRMLVWLQFMPTCVQPPESPFSTGASVYSVSPEAEAEFPKRTPAERGVCEIAHPVHLPECTREDPLVGCFRRSSLLRWEPRHLLFFAVSRNVAPPASALTCVQHQC